MSYLEHKPVLLNEALEALSIDKKGIYMDVTFGRGGHSREILDRLGSAGRLIGIDRDPVAIKHASVMAESDERFSIFQSAFSGMLKIVDKTGFSGQIDGVLIDLGVSSPQLDDASRGFSFQKDGPLDMRMDTSSGQTASEWLQSSSEEEIVRVLREYGEERFARRIAAAIIEFQKERAFLTTDEFAEVVRQAIPCWEKHKDPATRTFQAVRIAVNDELQELRDVLVSSLQVLKQGGRLVVISFHSLEDRIVKRFMRDHARPQQPNKRLPVEPVAPDARLIGKPVRPGANEVDENIRARSAIMRVMEKL